MIYALGILLFLVFSLPLQVGIAVLILVTSGYPIFFGQKRIGKNGEPFTIYKFRTMKRGSEAQQKGLRNYNEADGPVFKIHNDPRYTRVGKFLAHTGLDELPQLFNVVAGDMALFGPRPLPVSEAKKLTIFQKKRETVRPGIISPAILTGAYHKNFSAWMRSDVQYAQEKTFARDISLCIASVGFLCDLLTKEIKRILS
jgi:lipopolysaccharide/colanic/teichoic acid biosynthesis glycosyltransferase